MSYPRTPSTAAARPCGRVDLVHQLFANTSRTEHPLRRRRWTRRVKDLGRGCALVPQAGALRGTHARGQRCSFTVSATDQSSRAPNDLPAPEPGARAPLTGGSPRPPVPRALARVGGPMLPAGVEGPLPVPSTPGGGAMCVAATSCSLPRLPSGSTSLDRDVDDSLPACSAWLRAGRAQLLTPPVMPPARPA